MIEIAALGARRCPAHGPELAGHRDEVNEGSARAKLIEADARLLAFLGATEDLLVEAAHPLKIRHAQHNMIKSAQLEGRHRHGKTELLILNRSPGRPGPSSRRGKDRSADRAGSEPRRSGGW